MDCFHVNGHKLSLFKCFCQCHMINYLITFSQLKCNLLCGCSRPLGSSRNLPPYECLLKPKAHSFPLFAGVPVEAGDFRLGEILQKNSTDYQHGLSTSIWTSILISYQQETTECYVLKEMDVYIQTFSFKIQKLKPAGSLLET